MHNSFAAFDIADIGGYHSFYPKRYAEYLFLSQHGPGKPLPEKFSRWTQFGSFGSPLIDLINTKYVLLPPSFAFNHPKLKLVYDREIKIYENTSAFPRVFFTSGYQLCHDRKAAYKMLAGFSIEDFKQKVLLESPPDAVWKKVQHAAEYSAGTSIRVISYTPNRIELEVTADGDGFVVIGDNYHPAWHAWVDGIPGKVLRANYIMRALPITAGSHSIVLLFRPKLLMGGMIISTVCWTMLFVFVGGLFCRRIYRARF
jgi:hypothetical protein